MDQTIGSEAPRDPATAAFEALKREVALLNVAIGGLAAERASAPDYSETLGEIAQGVRVAVARTGKLASSAALSLTPAEMAQQITAAGAEARRQDRIVLHQAQEMLQRATGELRAWIDTARLASAQNWRLLQAAAVGLLTGALLGVWLPSVVARNAPAPWRWPEKMATGVLGRDMWSAGERMLETADAQRWRDSRAGGLIVAQNREALAKCVRGSRPDRLAQRCLIQLGSQEGRQSDFSFTGPLAEPRRGSP